MKRNIGPYILMVALVVSLTIPNLALVVTERQPFFIAVCNILLPCGLYTLLSSLSRKIGRTVWLMFPFIFLAAFQIVLTYLFGRSIIGVDMFLNLITTNAEEVGEMLGGIIYGVVIVFCIYVPLLIGGYIAIRHKAHLGLRWMVCQRKVSLAMLLCGVISWGISTFTNSPLVLKDDVFPANVIYNAGLSCERMYRSAQYVSTSSDFVFDARRVVANDADSSMIVVFVIGETSRAENFAVAGYSRNTTPNLSSLQGLVSFSDAMSESNTTHKSVPMLLSSVDATDFDDIYKQKSIITAFKEAGFKTAFFSNQKPNRSFIELFGNEADTCCYIDALDQKGKKPYDNLLVDCLSHYLKGNRGNVFVVLHTYGSHFNYSDRYPAAFRKFLPDNIPAATPENRESLVNAYDNTILYTDYILDRIIKTVDGSSRNGIVIYTSDHGEDLFDDGHHFMHASPIPSLHQLHVPLFVWVSPSYASSHESVASSLVQNSGKRVSTSSTVFHTLLQMADIQTPVLERSKSIADTSFRETERVYIDDRNTPVSISHIME